jgi:hypothetical protein
MGTLRHGLAKPLTGPFAQIPDFTINGRAFSQAGQEIGGPARGLAAAGFTVIEEFAESAGPQAGRNRDEGGSQSADRIHGVIRSR